MSSNENRKGTYTKPELVSYGRVLDLTQGSSGSIGDGDAGLTKRPR